MSERQQMDALMRSQKKGAAVKAPPPERDDEEDGVLDEEDMQSLLSMRSSYNQGSPLDDDEDELASLNDPDMRDLGDAPLLGMGRGQSEMWGNAAETMGRASSPKLFSQASTFPTAVQYRVWRWENGIPVALGAIDVEASEDDFIRQFLAAMPAEGDGRFQFRLRPVDIRGIELGKEFTMNISESHSTLVKLRKRAKNEEGPAMMHGGQPIIVNPATSHGDPASASMAEEMGRMFESAVEAAERRTQVLQETLEEERARLRQEEQARMEERINMATRSTDVVQKMTERLMAADQARAKEQLAGQEKQTNMLLSTMTAVFQQQQEAARQQAERLREADMSRLAMDREFFDRQRQQAEHQRAAERQDWERKQQLERDRLDQEAKRMEAQRAYEIEQMRLEAQRREAEVERKRQAEKEELHLRMERERMEMERQRQQMAEERERWRAELEEKRRQESMEWERKRAMEREEAERRERDARERAERERMQWQQQLEAQKAEMEHRRLAEERKAREEREAWERRLQLERQESERRDQLRREEMQREAERRREEVQLQMKQMELAAQRDREHQEKLAEMARLEREAQRETLLAREKSEAEHLQLAEQERQRQHALTMKEMEIAKERDREHAERMLQLSKSQAAGGFGQLGETLGMDTPELLSRIFGGGGESSSWSDAIPKVLGSIAEVGKAALSARAPAPAAEPRKAARRPRGPMVQVQTPQGPQIVPLEVAKRAGLAENEYMVLPGPEGQPQAEMVPVRGTAAPQQFQAGPPAEKKQQSFKAALPASAVVAQPTEGMHPLEQGRLVDTTQRAKAKKLSLLQQKKARKGLRKLVEQFATQPESEWNDLVTQAIIENLDIYYYIEAVTFYAAVAEAGADAELADKVAAKLQEHELVPKDLPYTEIDWTQLQAAQAETPEEDA